METKMNKTNLEIKTDYVKEYFQDMIKTLEGETKKHGLKDTNYFLSLALKSLEENQGDYIEVEEVNSTGGKEDLTFH